jgi:hypothetical protein
LEVRGALRRGSLAIDKTTSGDNDLGMYEETVFYGARSILLTEDNLINLVKDKSEEKEIDAAAAGPDLILDLPR